MPSTSTQPTSANLFELFQGRFPEDRSRPLLRMPDGRGYSYAELEESTGRYARLLSSLGARKGDRVAVQVDKSPEALFVYLACVRAGLVYLPLNTAYRERELDYFLGDAEPAVVVARPQGREMLEPLCRRHGVNELLILDADGTGTLVERSTGLDADFGPVACAGEDVAAVLYTSGTTGQPKGAMLTHANLAANARVLHRAWGWIPTDVLLHALPIFHVHGLFVACHCVLLNGTAMYFLPKFEARTVMEFLPRCTVMMGVPTFYTRLLGERDFGAETCRNMRLFISGSAPLLEQTFAEWRARTGHTILERYGMSETIMLTSNPLEGPRKAGTVGTPLPGVSLRIMDEAGKPCARGAVGGIEVKGPSVFEGYWRKPEKTAAEFTADGWFRTGDMGRIDDDGYVSIVGRAKDLVITGGYNVYPKEVELCIDRIDGVAESAVIGLPDPDFGEAVTAVVVRKPDGSRLDANAIIAPLKEQIANYKVPKHVYFVDALPRNAMGKVQKQALRERFRAPA